MIVTVLWTLESEGPIYGIGSETASFISLVKVLKPLGILFIIKLYAEVCDSYFWKKRAVMFARNLISQNCSEFVPYFAETSPALENSCIHAWLGALIVLLKP